MKMVSNTDTDTDIDIDTKMATGDPVAIFFVNNPHF